MPEINNRKRIKLRKFYLRPDWREFVSSMLFSNNEGAIAESEWDCQGDILNIRLSVAGDSRIDFNGETYIHPEEYPEILRERIKAHPYDFDVSSEAEDTFIDSNEIFVDMNNWFEYLLSNGDGYVFENDITKTEPEEFLEQMKEIALQSYNLEKNNTVIDFPLYVLEGYDKDNDVYTQYAFNENLEEIKENAFTYITYTKNSYVSRKCSDNTYEPIDSFNILNRYNDLEWTSTTSIVFRLYMDVEFNKEVNRDASLGLGSFTFMFANKEFQFDFEECSAVILGDGKTVEYEFKNPDVAVFPEMSLLTREMLANVTSIKDINCEDLESPDDKDGDVLVPIAIKEAAFVVINECDSSEYLEDGDASQYDIPSDILANWKF